ncbi:hypothetical protein ACE1TH_10670 [Shouchella sp. JSM 1781072]|uniref:hypothetical protein n=1 Tax=Shouchella sp. JSM 1781072 TaxID=3344581 RepID=UPI0035C1BCE2
MKLEQVHNQFILDWHDAMQTGNTSKLERMTDSYFVTFFYEPSEKPLFFTKEEALIGMQQSVNELRGAKKRFNNRLIRMKNDNEAVVFYELIVEKNGEQISRLFTVENWSRDHDKWFLANEIQQQL